MMEGILESAAFRNISIKITQDKVNKMINDSLIMMVLSLCRTLSGISFGNMFEKQLVYCET